MKPGPEDLARKAVLDSVLLAIPGVEGGDMAGLPAYFVGKRMFACIANGGVGLRFSTSEAAELQFSRDGVGPFQPKGMPSTREWVQINHQDPADYANDLELFRASIAFVRSSRG